MLDLTKIILIRGSHLLTWTLNYVIVAATEKPIMKQYAELDNQ